MARARHSLWLLAGLMLLPGLASAQDYGAKGFKLEDTTPRESSPEDTAAGKVLYEEYCSQCHGDEGDGNGVMADRLHPRPRDFRRPGEDRGFVCRELGGGLHSHCDRAHLVHGGGRKEHWHM